MQRSSVSPVPVRPFRQTLWPVLLLAIVCSLAGCSTSGVSAGGQGGKGGKKGFGGGDVPVTVAKVISSTKTTCCL